MRFLMPATSADEEERNATVAVIPIGSFEQHGPYLPLSTDTVVACAIVEAIGSAYPVFCLPPITISCSHEHADYAGTVSISSRTLFAVLDDIANSLDGQGISKMVIVNGHGGNYVLRNYAQEASAQGRATAIFPSAADWRSARNDAGIVTSDHSDMHAGELETSILLHVAPQLVREGNSSADCFADDRPHLLTLGMRGYTKSGVIGAPSLGSADKGKRVLASLVQSFDDYMNVLG